MTQTTKFLVARQFVFNHLADFYAQIIERQKLIGTYNILNGLAAANAPSYQDRGLQRFRATLAGAHCRESLLDRIFFADSLFSST